MTVDLHVKTFALSLVLLAGGIATFAQSTGPTYPGRKHTYSHGGTYRTRSGAPAAGSSHKGGHYNSATGNHHYGRHKGH